MKMVETMALAYWAKWQAEWKAIMPVGDERSIPSWDMAPCGGREATMRGMTDVLKAMREPTDEMIDAGQLEGGVGMRGVWWAMIDKAIAEAETP